MRRISARVENTIKNICKIQGQYTVNDVERALERRQREGTVQHKYGRNRPTHWQVVRILERASWSIVIVNGGPGKATKYRYEERNDDGQQ